MKEEAPMAQANVMTDAARERARLKARDMRYKKPIVHELNLDDMNNTLYDIMEACAEVCWYMDTPDGEDSLLQALDGDEEEAYEFQAAFSLLEIEAESLRDDLENEWLPDCFDLFFAGIGAQAAGGGPMLGYDAYEGDYYGLSSFEAGLAEEEAAEKLMRLTKKQLIEAAHICFKVAFAYHGVRTRYDNLQAAMDVLRGQNMALLKQVRAISEAYEEAEAEGFGLWKDSTKKLDQMLVMLPERIWIE
jgi:hypothetical protein